MRVVVMVIMVIMMTTAAPLDSTNHVGMLPAPDGVSMESVNMRHVLKWRPLQAGCSSAVLYSVQFQGEFELTVLNGSWVDAPECQLTPEPRCDLTFDLGSDSDYNLRVGAQCGAALSPRTRLRPPFNRRDTLLTVPEMEVKTVGDVLQVWFGSLPVTAVVNVSVWRRGDELQAALYTVSAEQQPLQLSALLVGEVYCIRAQTVVDARLQSSSTDTRCVSVAGREAAWRTPTTAAVTVVIATALLLTVFWCVFHCRRPDAYGSFFHKEPLPSSLRSDWDIRISTGSEEAELYERIYVVQSADSSR